VYYIIYNNVGVSAATPTREWRALKSRWNALKARFVRQLQSREVRGRLVGGSKRIYGMQISRLKSDERVRRSKQSYS